MLDFLDNITAGQKKVQYIKESWVESRDGQGEGHGSVPWTALFSCHMKIVHCSL